MFEQNAAKLAQAEREGRLAEIVRNGWIVEDRGFEEGGLQFDNGLCGVALCELYLATGDERYRAAARRTADWADPHNAMASYHFILTRALADLFGALANEDPLLPRVTAALRLALTARHDGFDQGLIPTINDAIEAQVLVAELAPTRRRLLGDTGREQALAVLSRFLDTRWRAGALPADPSAWGRYLVLVRGGATAISRSTLEAHPPT